MAIDHIVGNRLLNRSQLSTRKSHFSILRFNLIAGGAVHFWNSTEIRLPAGAAGAVVAFEHGLHLRQPDGSDVELAGKVFSKDEIRRKETLSQRSGGLKYAPTVKHGGAQFGCVETHYCVTSGRIRFQFRDQRP